MVDSSREAFRKWAEDLYDNVLPVSWDSDEECYTFDAVQGAWLAWQVSRSAAIEEIAERAGNREYHGMSPEEMAERLRALKGEG